MRNINDPAYYDGDTGQWTPVPLADMSVRELARTALAIVDLVTEPSSPWPIHESAANVVREYKRELRARSIAAWRTSQSLQS